jgi:hypothetical protein
MASNSVKIYSPSKIYPFVKSQNFLKIREKSSKFTDDSFPASLKLLGNDSSELVRELCESMKLPGHSVKFLCTKLKWERAEVLSLKNYRIYLKFLYSFSLSL